MFDFVRRYWRVRGTSKRAEANPPADRVAEVEAERIKLKVGLFQADLDGACMGRVLIDGREVDRVRGFTVTADAGSLVHVRLVIVP